MSESKFHEKLAIHFAELVEKVFKRPMDLKDLERFHKTMKKMATDIITSADHAAISRCKRMNDAVKKSFGLIAVDISDLEEKVMALEEQVKAQHHFIKEWLSTDRTEDDSE